MQILAAHPKEFSLIFASLAVGNMLTVTFITLLVSDEKETPMLVKLVRHLLTASALLWIVCAIVMAYCGWWDKQVLGLAILIVIVAVVTAIGVWVHTGRILKRLAVGGQ